MNSTAPPHPAFKTTLHRARALRTPACSPGPPSLWQRHTGRPALHEGCQSGEAARCGGPGHLLGATCSSSLPWGLPWGGPAHPGGPASGNAVSCALTTALKSALGHSPRVNSPLKARCLCHLILRSHGGQITLGRSLRPQHLCSWQNGSS